MIDIGHPFSKPFQELIDSLEESVREGVEQPAQTEIPFLENTSSYEIRGPVHDISRVTGIQKGKFVVFERNKHYRYSSGRLLWLEPPPKPENAESSVREDPPWYPDNNSSVRVEYTYRDLPSGITDFNAGSVAGTLVRAVAREFKFLYEQMDQAYRRAFIDIAQGVALDNVVALLGIARNPAQPAKGFVTFFLKKPSKEEVPIAVRTRLADAAGQLFVVTEGGVIEPTAKSVTVPVVAVEPGRKGNVGSGSITVMPTPPKKVDGGVVNEQPLTGGEEAESDEELRERAKHALDIAGNATQNALKYSILEVDGVDDVEVRDHATDESIPLGEVRVRYSGGDATAIAEAIEQTRAAGILVRAEEVTTVLLSGTVYVIPDVGFTVASLGTLTSRILDALKALRIGEPLYLRRVAALAYQVPGIADIAEAQLNTKDKKEPSKEIPVVDPFVVDSSELIQPDTGKLSVMALDGIKVTGEFRAPETGDDKCTFLKLRLVRADDTAVAFRSFKLNIVVVLRARLKGALPDQTPQRICQVEKEVELVKSDTVEFEIPNSDIKDEADHPGFRADRHDPNVEFQVSSAAYPALKPGLAKVQITEMN